MRSIKVLSIHLILGLVLAVSTKLSAQTSMGFYNMGNATFQSSFYNPTYIPEGKLFIGLPVLSGVHLNINNKFDYSDVFVRTETGNKIDLNGFLASLQKNNTVSATVDLNLFHVAYTARNGMNFSLFANERVQTDVLYTRQLMQFAIEGNISQLGETIKIDKTAASATYFREIGVGFSGAIPKLKMNVGARLKYLQGIANASTSNYTAQLTTNNVDYQLDLDLEGAALRTSGVETLQGNTTIDPVSYLINNANKGVSADFGMSMEVNRYVNFSASIVDLGFISWQEDIKNYTIPDTVMRYGGLNLKEPKGLEQNIKDSLINRFKNRVVKTSDAYTTSLNPKIYTSISYKTPIGGEVVGSLGTRYIKGKFNYLVGAGYRHRFGKYFIGSASVTRLPQQFLNVGAGLAIKGGPVQFYLAADQLVKFDLTKAKSFDFRVGMNFIIGKRKAKSSTSTSGGSSIKQPKTQASANSFLGKKVKVKGQDDIYTVIKKQDRRKQKDYTNPAADIPSEGGYYEGEVISEPIPSESLRKFFGGKSDPIPSETKKSRGTVKSPPIPGSNKRVRGGKSDPIPKAKRKARGGKSDPIPGSKKIKRGGKSDPIPSGGKKVKSRKSSPIPKGKKKRRN